MVTFFIHIRSLLIFVILIQSVFLYKLNVLNTNQLDSSSSSSFNDDLSSPIEDKNLKYGNDDDDDISNNIDEDNLKNKRSLALFGKQALPQRRSNRPHWNPLVAAYKRCGEFTSYDDRQSCFKNAVQILFVHKLRK